MSLYNNSVTRVYDFLFVELADPRTNDWFLIRDPMPGLTIIGAYLYFVLNWGPKYMKDRKPWDLTNVLIVYNFIQVLVSSWLVWEGLTGAWLFHYSWKCEPVDFSLNPHALRVARGVYIYFLAKMSELLDTVFFVLRKKDRQITFLHMYHHTVMPMISWGVTKYFPGGHGTFIGVINSFVHIIMYFYYMMSAFGPKYQKFLWWKKYITTMQLAQFCIAFIHSAQLLVHDCGFPRWSLYFTLPNAIFFYYLFYDFYNKAYPIEMRKKAIRNGVKPKEDTTINRDVSDDNISNRIVSNGKISNGNIPNENKLNGNIPNGNISNGNISNKTKSNENIPNGNIPSSNKSNGNIPSGDKSNGDIPSGDKSNGNIPSGNKSNGNIPSGNKSNGNIPNWNISNGDLSSGNKSNGNGYSNNMEISTIEKIGKIEEMADEREKKDA